MDSTEDDPLDYLLDHRSPDRVINPMVPGDSILQTEHTSSAVEANRRDRQGSMFVPERTTTSPEPDQARIKQEPDTDGGLESRIEEEEPIDDRNLQEASKMAPHDENLEGGPPTSSNDNEESESFWAVETSEKNSATANHPKQGSDAQKIAEFNLHTEALERWSSLKIIHEAQLQQNPGSLVDMKMLEFCEAQIRETRDKLRAVEIDMQNEDLNKEASSDAVANDEPKPPPRKRRKVAKTIEDHLRRKNEKNEGKRELLFRKPVAPSATKKKKNKRDVTNMKTRVKHLFSTHSSDDDTMDAPKAKQRASEADELPDSVEKDEKARIREANKIKRDVNMLNAASRNLGGKCRATDESNVADCRWDYDGVRSTLSHHQHAGCEWMLTKEFSEDRGGINADEMGMGKTLQTLVCVLLHPPKEDEPKPTLIVAPAHAITTWEEQIKEHLDADRRFTFTRFQAKKNEDMNTLESLDIIFTSFQELVRADKPTNVRQEIQSPDGAGEDEEETPDDPSAMLFQMEFHRVIVDEAHHMKNPDSKTYHACCKLKAKYRWALTGTPAQNKAEEVWSYMSFLRLPWLPSKAEFNLRVNNLDIKENREQHDKQIDEIMSRRKRLDKIAGHYAWEAKPKHEDIKWIKFSEEERVIYEYIDNRSRQIAARHQQKTKAAGKSRNSGGVSLYLVLLQHLRQSTAHFFLLEKAMKNKMCGTDIRKMQQNLEGLGETPLFKQLELYIDKGVFGASSFGSQLDIHTLLDMILTRVYREEEVICNLCENVFAEPQKNQCGHTFCLSCIQAARDKGEAKCPTCQEPLGEWSAVQIADPDPDQEDEQVSDEQVSAEERAVLEKYNLTPEEAAAYKRRDDRRHCAKKGEDGKKLGNDYLDVQPRAKDSDLFLDALDQDYPKPLTPSSKTTMVKSIVLDWQREAPDDKIIIFTQFVQLGQILGRMLQAEGKQFLYYFGEMSSKQKDAAVKTFAKAKDVKVMVVSLKCGGTALNLQCANRVILVDPWWNESIEDQAFARVFRQRQEKETYLWRILIEDTVDARIHDMQKRKRANIGEAMKSQDYLRMLGGTTEDENGNLITEADYDI